ncbi:hypothetical protein [Sinimarinibacterium thermocellulolyticum]|uniref:Uncharacterized protein n=1 Tax=Sinimarinibacterium thermocellulolyticum TaxID=3170016 RepID=A0ABV2A8Y4_9GAMM
MFRKVLRWAFGLPLLIGGGGLFMLGLLAGTVLAVPAGLVAVVGFWLIAPHKFKPTDRLEVDALDSSPHWNDVHNRTGPYWHDVYGHRPYPSWQPPYYPVPRD